MSALATQPTSEGMNPTPAASLAGDTTFERSASVTLARLQRAFRSLLEAIPDGVRKAADLQRAFDLDSKLAGQVFKVATAPDPVAAGINVPPRVSLERMLRAATRRRIPAAIITRVSEAFEQFERMVQEEAGDREEFDSLIASSIPEERAKLHLASREMMYHAARNIRGLATEASSMSVLFYPAADDAEKLEVVRLYSDIGLRRIHRGTKILSSTVSADPESQALTLDGRPVADHASVMLEPFCSTPVPKFYLQRTEKEGSVLWYALEGEEVGIRSAVDAVRADYVHTSLKTRYWAPDRPKFGASKHSHIPTRWQVLDLLFFDDMLSNNHPEAAVYDTIYNGSVSILSEAERQSDRVDFTPIVRTLGSGPGAFECSHIPRYEEMITHVCGMRSWDVSRLQGFRVEIQYPVYSWQTLMSLTKLPKP